jgi:hypothetical protein
MILQAIAKFRLGRIVATPAVLESLSQDDILEAIRRHQAGDWGEASEQSRITNELAVESGIRLFSVYRSGRGTTFWVITEADRSSTTILLPSDY